jgi:hypothetical protein
MSHAAGGTDSDLASLAQVIGGNVPQSRLVSLLARARGDVTYAAHFFWEDVDALGDWPLGPGDAPAAAVEPVPGRGGVPVPAPVPAERITAEQIAQLFAVTQKNLDDDQMRALLARCGGQVAIAINEYFEGFDEAKADLLRRGLPVHTDQPAAKRRSTEDAQTSAAAVRKVVEGDDDECELIGVKGVEADPGLLELPHARCNCPTLLHFRTEPAGEYRVPVHRSYTDHAVQTGFLTLYGTDSEPSKKDRDTNIKSCANCFCWVCASVYQPINPPCTMGVPKALCMYIYTESY